MKRILLLSFLLTMLYGEENTMIVYGNINVDMDVWFESVFSSGEFTTSYNFVTNQNTYESKREVITTDTIRDNKGDYSVKIPLTYKNDKFTLSRVILKVRKKYCKGSKEGNEIVIYAPHSNENYLLSMYKYETSEHTTTRDKPTDEYIEELKKISPMNIIETLPSNMYYILAPENRYECQYRDYKKIGLGTSISDCVIKVIKGEIGREKPINGSSKIKIDIFLNDTDRDGNQYNPEEEKKKSFFSKLITNIFGD